MYGNGQHVFDNEHSYSIFITLDTLNDPKWRFSFCGTKMAADSE